MNYLLNYSKWKSLNEGLIWDVIEKEPIGGTTHKVKVKYLDGNSFKVKAVNDRDMVGADGSIDPTLMDGIVAFLKGHDSTDFSRQYPALQDLATFYKDNFFTVNVKKENDNKQVIVFTIQKRANFKGVTPETKVITDDKAAALAQAPEAKTLLATSDKSLLQNTAQTDTQTATGPVKLAAPIAIADIVNYTADSPFFKMFDDAVAVMATSKVFTDKRATDLIGKVADELEAKKIGENSIKLVKGLMAGFGATTFVDKYGRTKEQTQINQDFINKITALVPKAPTAQNSSRNYYLGLNGKMIFEQAAAPAFTLPADFKMEEFIKAISAGTPGELTTGDIKLPDGGLVKGKVAKGDAELIKAQQLIIKTLGEVLVKDPTFIKFKGYGADGNYGPTTEKMVAMAKSGFELKDQDGSVITAELINKLQTDRITESYLDLRGNLFEKFNVEAATKTASSYVPKKSTTVKKTDANTKKEDEKTSIQTTENKSIDLNKIATFDSTNKSIEFVAGLVATSIDLFGKDWGNSHLEWLKKQITALNALGGKFASTSTLLVYNADHYTAWSDIFTAYISPLSGGDATLKQKISSTGLKAVGSAKTDAHVNLILSAIAVKNDETIMSTADEKAISGAFMMLSPVAGKDKIEKLSGALGNADSGLKYLIDEFNGGPTGNSHSKDLAIWTIGALGYDATLFGLKSEDFTAAKDAIKLSLTK